MKVKDLIAELSILDPEMPVAKRSFHGLWAIQPGDYSGLSVYATLPTDDNRSLKMVPMKDWYKPAVYPNVDYLTIPEEE